MADAPDPRREAERRRAPRFNLSLPVTVTDAVSGRASAATVDNISLGGVLLLVDAPLVEGARLVIHLPVALDMTMRIEASVVRATAVGEFGVAFVSLGEDELDRLAAFVASRSVGDE